MALSDSAVNPATRASMHHQALAALLLGAALLLSAPLADRVATPRSVGWLVIRTGLLALGFAAVFHARPAARPIHLGGRSLSLGTSALLRGVAVAALAVGVARLIVHAVDAWPV